jgi:protein-disulfide isomerase
VSTSKPNRAERTRASQRAAEIRKAQQAKERRRRNAVVAAVVLLVLAVIAGIGYAVQASRDTTGEAASTPSGVDGYAVPVGKESAPVTVDLYEDFMCPVCGAFEKSAGDTLGSWVSDGTVRLRYHPIAILDRYSTTDYSTRSTNAFAAVVDSDGAEAAVAYHRLLFANQPEEGGPGLDDDKLADLAEQAGADGKAVQDALADDTFVQWVVNATNAASEDGVNSTPTVMVDGKKVDLGADPVAALSAAVKAAEDQ